MPSNRTPVSGPRSDRAGGSSTDEPDCASARAAATPRCEAGERDLPEARARGRGRTRIHASVITPSAPSEPSSIRRARAAPDPEALRFASARAA